MSTEETIRERIAEELKWHFEHNTTESDLIDELVSLFESKSNIKAMDEFLRGFDEGFRKGRDPQYQEPSIFRQGELAQKE